MSCITWNVQIHGHKHCVTCKPETNKYVFFVDDDHLTNIYRDTMKKIPNGLETIIRICGQECLFLVWDSRPDLVVDGIMQGRGMPYAECREKRRQSRIRGFRILRWLSFLAFTVLMVCLFRIPMEVEPMSRCISGSMSCCGLFFLSGHKIWKWRNW